MYVGGGVLILLPLPFPLILVIWGRLPSLHCTHGETGQSGHDLPRDL